MDDFERTVAACVEEIRARRFVPVDVPGNLSLAALVASASVPSDDPATRTGVLDAVAAHPDIRTLRLVRQRPTLVHRRAWQDVLTVATSRASWQMEFLPPTEMRLLEVLEARGTAVLDDDLARELDAYGADLGRTLVTRLLALDAGPTRLPSGATCRTLESWTHWAARTDPGLRPLASIQIAAAIERLDAAARALGPSATLPWWRKPLRRRW